MNPTFWAVVWDGQFRRVLDYLEMAVAHFPDVADLTFSIGLSRWRDKNVLSQLAFYEETVVLEIVADGPVVNREPVRSLPLESRQALYKSMSLFSDVVEAFLDAVEELAEGGRTNTQKSVDDQAQKNRPYSPVPDSEIIGRLTSPMAESAAAYFDAIVHSLDGLERVLSLVPDVQFLSFEIDVFTSPNAAYALGFHDGQVVLEVSSGCGSLISRRPVRSLTGGSRCLLSAPVDKFLEFALAEADRIIGP